MKQLNDGSSSSSSKAYLLHQNHQNRVECSVCLEVLPDNENSRTLSCGHMFHVNCIEQWVATFNNKRKRVNCPCCRKDI